MKLNQIKSNQIKSNQILSVGLLKRSINKAHMKTTITTTANQAQRRRSFISSRNSNLSSTLCFSDQIIPNLLHLLIIIVDFCVVQGDLKVLPKLRTKMDLQFTL